MIKEETPFACYLPVKEIVQKNHACTYIYTTYTDKSHTHVHTRNIYKQTESEKERKSSGRLESFPDIIVRLISALSKAIIRPITVCRSV